jgi:hypothetical protein
MQTTQLLVEIIVVGVGGAIAIMLAACAVFGVDDVASAIDTLSGISTILPLLALIYVLGIVIDSFAKLLFTIPKKTIRTKKFRLPQSDQNEIRESLGVSPIEDWDKNGEGEMRLFYHARAYVYQHADGLRGLFEYTRSMQRICRGWVFNSVFILISYLMCRWTDPVSTSLQENLFVSALFVIYGLGCLYGWYRMISSEAKRLSGQYPVVRQRVKQEIQAKS